MLEKTLGNEIFENLIEGVARGEYHLLFGAGASIGATSQDGRPIQTADFLAREILQDFSIDLKGEKLALKDAYEEIENVSDRKGRGRDEYFNFRFSNCIPTWQTIIPHFRWKKIWSLNIDDVIEVAYKKEHNAKQQIRTYDWTSLYNDPEYKDEELQIIHLHGYAPGLLNRTSKLIFSILEYLQATSSNMPGTGFLVTNTFKNHSLLSVQGYQTNSTLQTL
jgi:hypothetical protein